MTNQPQKQVPRPTTTDEQPPFELEYSTEEKQVDVSLQLVEAMGDIRQMGLCHGNADALSPKEIAAYNAALDRLEKFIDKPS
jgi:hypothetical protein